MYHEFTISSENYAKRKSSTYRNMTVNCLGKKFTNCIVDTIKSKRETRVIFTDSKKPFPWSPSYSPKRSEEQKVFLTKGGGSNYGKFNNGSSKMSSSDTNKSIETWQMYILQGEPSST